MVYVAEDAKIGSPFAALGAAARLGRPLRCSCRGSAPHKTLDLIYTGRLMSGAEAVASGLFSRALPSDELRGRGGCGGRDGRGRRPSGVPREQAHRRRACATASSHLWDAVAAENAAQVALRDTDDYHEGFAAFQQKRRPGFTGR